MKYNAVIKKEWGKTMFTDTEWTPRYFNEAAAYAWLELFFLQLW